MHLRLEFCKYGIHLVNFFFHLFSLLYCMQNHLIAQHYIYYILWSILLILYISIYMYYIYIYISVYISRLLTQTGVSFLFQTHGILVGCSHSGYRK